MAKIDLDTFQEMHITAFEALEEACEKVSDLCPEEYDDKNLPPMKPVFDGKITSLHCQLARKLNASCQSCELA